MKRYLALIFIFLLGCTILGPDYDEIQRQCSIRKNIFHEAIETKDADLCDQLGIYSNRCYNQVARALEQPELCRDVPREPDSGTCRAAPGYIAEKYCCEIYSFGGFEESLGKCMADSSNYDLEACNEIQDKTQKDDCFLHISKNINLTDLTVCDFIQDQDNKESCFLLAFIGLCENGNPICNLDACDSDMLVTSHSKDVCLVEVAAFEQNITICDIIEDDIEREICLFRTQ